MGVTTLRFMGPDPGPQFELNEKLLAEFEAQTGIQVEQIAGPESATDRLNEYLITLGSESDEVDVYHKIKSIVYRFDVLERWAASRTRWMCTRST
ncbi:MAG: hypothetical protein Kow0031_34720 [Anaerolineae bacterium]